MPEATALPSAAQILPLMYTYNLFPKIIIVERTYRKLKNTEKVDCRELLPKTVCLQPKNNVLKIYYLNRMQVCARAKKDHVGRGRLRRQP